MIDIRPLPESIHNLNFIKGDATSLQGIRSGSISALSCLHALEHFGLGRYGDPLDHDGWRKALYAFKRVVATDGYLYLSVPVGKNETVMFNAHRIFNPLTIIFNLIPTFSLLEFTLLHHGQQSCFDFSCIQNKTELSKKIEEISSGMMGIFDCGIFIFKKS